MSYQKNKSRKIAFISSFLPRRCGIATFTSDLISNVERACSGALDASVIAMESVDHFNYGDKVKMTIQRDVKDDYIAAAEYINSSGSELVSLQHEYGLFGGKAGSYICELLEALSVPVVTTFHAVLENPEVSYRDALIRIAEVSSKLVVMSRYGVELLKGIYGIPAEKISMIPHGIPDMSFEDTDIHKRHLGLAGRHVILTFGLLGRNKGIEWGIRALYEIVKQDPSMLYIVLGATHPEVKRKDGEEYRLFLQKLVADLGLECNVKFVDQFVSDEKLHQFLNATDFYLTPYINKEQLTSGTLAFATGMGKVVISTPYWHASELLENERGILVPFKDYQSIADTILSLLDDPVRYNAIRKRAFEFGRSMTWIKSGEAYCRLFQNLKLENKTKSILNFKVMPFEPMEVSELPDLRLDHFLRLSDDVGIIQHARHVLPDRFHGYCTDDNARALKVMVLCYRRHPDMELLRLMEIYLAFILHASRANGDFYNFMSYGRRFAASDHSDDATSRVIEALGTLIAYPPELSLVKLAQEEFLKSIEATDKFSLRGRAYEIFGIVDYLRRFTDDVSMRKEMGKAADCLVSAYRQNATPDWSWFESSLTYDNGVLPSALFAASQILQNKTYLEIAIKACRFIIKETFTGSRFSFVGCHGWYLKGEQRAHFDQQPIEAWSTVRLAREAFASTGDLVFLELMRKAFYWFLGDNDSATALYDSKSGGCYDGLSPGGVNLNQGAESLISYTLAYLSLEEEEKGLATGKKGGDLNK